MGVSGVPGVEANRTPLGRFCGALKSRDAKSFMPCVLVNKRCPRVCQRCVGGCVGGYLYAIRKGVPGLPRTAPGTCIGLSPSPLNRNPNKFQGVPASLCWKGFGGFGMLKESHQIPMYAISVLVDVLVDYRRCVGG